MRSPSAAALFPGSALTSISKPPASDFLVAGAGIVGLATALELQYKFPAASITILEKEPRPGLHASGRNSGVLHSGIYYAPGTLKAQVCADGARRMKRFAREHGIACVESGKVIVAKNSAEVSALDRLMANARDNGIRAERLDEPGVKRLEPHANGAFGGIHCPETAVIDSLAVVKTCADLFQKRGGAILWGQKIVAANENDKWIQSANSSRYGYGVLINCAGAHADRIARLFGLARDYALVPFKGIYFKLKPARSELVRSSIYPVPDLTLPFLGVHFTRVASGDVYVGPTAIPAFGRENYGFLSGLKIQESFQVLGRLVALYGADRGNFRHLVHVEMKKYFKPCFVAAARALIPEIRSSDLVSCGKVGIRPQLVHLKDNRLEMDYVFEQSRTSLHVLNAISPAFTGAFAFAELIVRKIP